VNRWQQVVGGGQGSVVGRYPPDLIDLGDFVLRRARVEDAATVAASVRDNLEHLRWFMGWANEGWAQESTTAAYQRSRLAEAVREWQDRTMFEYLAVSKGEDGVHLGTVALHRRIGPAAAEIGYWLAETAQGHGYATRSAGALTGAALALDDVDRVEIHCDQANVRSAAVAARLGYRLESITDRPRSARSDIGRMMLWAFPARSGTSSG
jgi:RimJ/RimL family protein N-acetyltransferase